MLFLFSGAVSSPRANFLPKHRPREAEDSPVFWRQLDGYKDNRSTRAGSVLQIRVLFA